MIVLNFSELEKTLDIKLNSKKIEISKDSETLEKLILIKNEKALIDLLLEIKEKVFEKGMEEAEFRESQRKLELEW